MAPGIQTCSSSLRGKIVVDSPNIRYGQDFIEADYEYQNTRCSPNNNGTIQATPVTTVLTLRTERKVPRMGLMLAGWGGNNGSTVTAAILANRLGLEWETKDGKVKANYFGSLTQSATFNVGIDDEGRDVYSPMRDLVPMVNPNDIVLDGWDISNLNLADAMKRSAVLDINLQKLLYPHMKNMVPRKAIFDCDFVAANQAERANNVILSKNKIELIKQIERDIQDFKKSNNLDTVIVLWTANTERFTDVRAGVHDTWEHLESALKRNHSEIAPSTLYAIASINQGCTFINGSPQNTLIPGVIELAEQKNVFLGGDDFKSGQTKLKSVMVDFLVGAGIKPCSIVSYNHLGNNDGYNLSAPQTFRSKEISKSGVVDDMVGSNSILYGQGLSHPDHCVVIKYVPYVGDSKRAMDEYISELMLGGKNTIICHNTCEDSLLASPIIIDLAILAELCQRVKFFVHGKNDGFVGFNCILSLLSYLCKAPLVEKGAQIVNALAKQRSALENFLRALVSLPPVDNLYLQNKLPSRKYWYEQPKESVIARGKGNNISAMGKAVRAEE